MFSKKWCQSQDSSCSIVYLLYKNWNQYTKLMNRSNALLLIHVHLHSCIHSLLSRKWTGIFHEKSGHQCVCVGFCRYSDTLETMTCCRVRLSLRRPWNHNSLEVWPRNNCQHSISLPAPFQDPRHVQEPQEAVVSHDRLFLCDDFQCPLIVDWNLELCLNQLCTKLSPLLLDRLRSQGFYYHRFPQNFLEKLQAVTAFTSTFPDHKHTINNPWCKGEGTSQFQPVPASSPSSKANHNSLIHSTWESTDVQSTFTIWILLPFLGEGNWRKPTSIFQWKRKQDETPKHHPCHPCLVVEDILFERLFRELLCKRIHQFHLHLYAKLEPHRILTRDPHVKGSFWTRILALFFFPRIFFVSISLALLLCSVKKMKLEKSEQTAHAEGL